MYYYRPIGVYSSKTFADEERENRKNKNLPNDGVKNVIDVYFSKPEIDDLENVPEGQPKQKKRFPEIHKANLGDEIFLVARTENLIGKKLKIEIRQAKERQIADKDRAVIFKNQDRSGSITITVGKGTKDKDENGQDYFSKYANANKLENFAWKSFLLRPESDSEFEQWKKTIENSREKKLFLYFHAEVVGEQDRDATFLNTDRSEGVQNFSNSEGQYFEIGNGSKCFCNRDFTVDEMIGIIYNLRDKQKMISKREVFFNMGGEYISSLRVSSGKLTDDVNKAKVKLFTDELNSMFKKFSVNTCKRKIHFIGQMYLETIYFRYTYESRSSVPSNYRGGVPFQGRGMKQITHDFNYLSYYDYAKGTSFSTIYEKFCKRDNEGRIAEGVGECIDNSSKAREKGLDHAFYEKLKTFAKNLSQDLFHSFNSAGWYSTVRQRKTIDAMDEGFSNEIIKKVTKAINGGDNGLAERINFTNWTKEHLKYDSKCINK